MKRFTKQDLSCLELTQDLIRIDTVNPPGNEARATAYLSGLLEEIGWQWETVDLSEGRANIVARIEGDDPSRLPICFTGHLDVVPLGAAEWSHDPFGAEIRDGQLYGRGSSDMKSGVAAMVCAGQKMARFKNRKAGALLVLTAGEESGCEGARAMVRANNLRTNAGALVVGEPTGLYPIIAHKGALWTRIVSRGKAAHGSMPELGENAILKMISVLSRLTEFDLGPAHPLQGPPTLNIGVIRGGIIPNQVPDHCEALLDIRTVAGCDQKELFDRLSREAGDQAELERIIDAGPVLSEPSAPWIREVFEIAAPFAGEPPQPRSINYFTDAALLKPALGNPPTIICGPGDPRQAHQTDEHTEVALIDRAVDLYVELARRWCCG